EAPGEAEARVRRFDGEYRCHLFRANPLRDESGAVVTWYGVNTDIEDQKRAEAELRRAYDSFAHAQRLSRTGSFSTDLLGDDHTCSEETYRILEMDPGTKVTLGRVRERIHPEDRASFDETVERSRSGADVRFSYRIVTASGEGKHLRGVSLVGEQFGGRPSAGGRVAVCT